MLYQVCDVLLHVWVLLHAQVNEYTRRFAPRAASIRCATKLKQKNVKRTGFMLWCNLRLTNAKSSMLQEYNADVALTHESHNPHEREE